MFKLLAAHLVVVVDHAQADGISLCANRIENSLGPIKIAIGAHSHHAKRMAQKFGFQLIVILRRSLADADDGFHGGLQFDLVIP